MTKDPLATPQGSEGRDFPATTWSSVLAEADSPRRRERIEKLCQTYWRPVFQFFRVAAPASIEDAKDLCQAFFVQLVEYDLIARYEPSKGRFRTFLKGALRLFLGQARRDAGRLKRGGGKPIVPLDIAELNDPLADPRQKTPEELFDEQWADDVLEGGIVSLQKTLESQGKSIYYKVYEAAELKPLDGERPTGKKIAEALNLKVHDVENYLSYARTLLRQLILKQVSDYVTTRQELIEEMKDLFPR